MAPKTDLTDLEEPIKLLALRSLVGMPTGLRALYCAAAMNNRARDGKPVQGPSQPVPADVQAFALM